VNNLHFIFLPWFELAVANSLVFLSVHPLATAECKQSLAV